MSDAYRYATRAVLASGYPWTDGAGPRRLTHVVETTWLGTEVRVLCSRVQLANMADKHATDESAPATCSTCARRDPRSHTGTSEK